MSDADERHNREAIVYVGALFKEVLLGVGTEALRSIQEGSELTGAPGQPVDTGALRASWQLIPRADSLTIGTNVVYAEAIEDGIGKYGPLVLRSQVGGFHSVAQTVANMDRIVAAVVDRVGNRPGSA